ncbi:MAG TPA: VOC family protein [Rhizomicrobium sp.]
MAVDRIIPVLVYRDIAAAQAFLVKAFGFREGRLDRDGEGNIVHAEVHHGDNAIWIHRVTVAHGMSAARKDTASSGLVVHVEDVDAHFARARAAGAVIDSEPRDQEYGQREYGARDPEGRRWWFATPLAAH